MVAATDSAKKIYRLEVFRDVAERRCKEAKHLFEVARRSCDGAIACALLSTECALKATLLFGYDVTFDHELPPETYRRYFQSKYGHALVEIYRALPAKVSRAKAPFEEIRRLDGCDRYAHRYGARRPRKLEGQPLISDTEAVITWMKGGLS